MDIDKQVVATPSDEFKKQIQDGLITNRKIANEGNISK